MPIIGYDSARPKFIPQDAKAIFPYADGPNAWSHTLFPQALYRYITVEGDPHADICDYEPGCVWPVERVMEWAYQRRQHGHGDLTVYTDRFNFTAVKDAMHKAGLTWHLFLATLDGTILQDWQGMHVRAVQYTTRTDMFDESEVYDEWWLNRP